MNRKTTKRALGLSFVSLLLCVTMLMGSTFAWFTDNATVAVNTIQSGNLNVGLQMLVDDEWVEAEGKTLGFVDETGKVLEKILWEPGCSYLLQPFKIVNNGNLALKFDVVVSAVTGDAKLAEAIEYGLQLGDVHNLSFVSYGDLNEFNNLFDAIENPEYDFNVLEPGEAMDTAGDGITFHMKEEAGNDYQDLTITGFAITVHAAQATVESDSFGDQYDANAQYDKATVVTTEELKTMLNDAADAGSGDGTIAITSNLVLAEGETWTPIKVDGYNGAGVITVEGNGKTIRGLNAPLFSGGFAGNSGIVIKDLTIADSNIVSTNSLGSGAFIETIDSMPTITLINCHVKNSTITGSRTGGLIGWNSGYDNVNDGSVKTYVTIENCSVTNCEITGAGTVGGIVGHAGANAWTYNTIKNCKVENCTLTSNDDSYRVGAIVGTANVGEVTITGCTSIGNTIKQNNNGTEIARPAGQSELYGRFVPDATGKLTIDGVEIK